MYIDAQLSATISKHPPMTSYIIFMCCYIVSAHAYTCISMGMKQQTPYLVRLCFIQNILDMWLRQLAQRAHTHTQYRRPANVRCCLGHNLKTIESHYDTNYSPVWPSSLATQHCHWCAMYPLVTRSKCEFWALHTLYMCMQQVLEYIQL